MVKFVTTTRNEKIKLERAQAIAIHPVRENHARKQWRELGWDLGMDKNQMRRMLSKKEKPNARH